MTRRKARFSVTADRMVYPARVTKEIRDWANAIGVKIYRAKIGDADKIGIHRLECEQHELEEALEQADRDSMPAIYLHTFKTWRATKKPSESEQELARKFNEGFAKYAAKNLTYTDGPPPKDVIRELYALHGLRLVEL